MLRQQIVELEQKIHDRATGLEALNQQLQHSRNLLRTIFDHIDDGLLLLDDTGTILAVNQALALLLGCTPRILIQQSWASLCHPPGHDGPPPVVGFPGRWVLSTLRDGRPRQRRERWLTATGDLRMLEMHALPIFAEHPPPSSHPHVQQVMLHVMDKTEVLRAEAVLVEHERLDVIRNITRLVTHEVNTPLQTILLAVELLPEAGVMEQRRFLSLVRQEIERISATLHQLEQMYRTHPLSQDGMEDGE